VIAAVVVFTACATMIDAVELSSAAAWVSAVRKGRALPLHGEQTPKIY
jgi:hypothetical protein